MNINFNNADNQIVEIIYDLLNACANVASAHPKNKASAEEILYSLSGIRPEVNWVDKLGLDISDISQTEKTVNKIIAVWMEGICSEGNEWIHTISCEPVEFQESKHKNFVRNKKTRLMGPKKHKEMIQLLSKKLGKVKHKEYGSALPLVIHQKKNGWVVFKKKIAENKEKGDGKYVNVFTFSRCKASVNKVLSKKYMLCSDKKNKDKFYACINYLDEHYVTDDQDDVSETKSQEGDQDVSEATSDVSETKSHTSQKSVSSMTRKEVVEQLKQLDISFPKKAKIAKLRDLLRGEQSQEGDEQSGDGVSDEEKSISSMTRKEVVEQLKQLDISFPKKAKLAKLRDLLRKEDQVSDEQSRMSHDESQEEQSQDLDDLSKAELVKLCIEKGVEYKKRESAKALREKLQSQVNTNLTPFPKKVRFVTDEQSQDEQSQDERSHDEATEEMVETSEDDVSDERSHDETSEERISKVIQAVKISDEESLVLDKIDDEHSGSASDEEDDEQIDDRIETITEKIAENYHNPLQDRIAKAKEMIEETGDDETLFFRVDLETEDEGDLEIEFDKDDKKTYRVEAKRYYFNYEKRYCFDKSKMDFKQRKQYNQQVLKLWN